MVNKKYPFYIKLACVLVSIISLGYLAILGRTILAPFIFAFLCSMVLLPLSNFLERKCKIPRAFSSFLSLITLVVCIVLIGYAIGSQMTNLSEDWPAFKDQVIYSSRHLQEWISNTFHVTNQAQIEYLTDAASKSINTGTTILSHTLLSLSSLLLFLMFTFLFTFFILLHRRLLLRFIVSLFPEQHSVTVYAIVNQVEYIVKRYILGLLLQMIIVSTLTFIAFSIIGVKYALLLSLITGVFNVIPYIGIITAALLAMLITFATASTGHLFFVLLAYIVIHAIDGNYIMPKIVGSKVQINTLIALVGLVLGEMLWGIMGMFLSLPVIAIFKVIFDRVDELKPWGMLIGEDDIDKHNKSAVQQVQEDEQRLEDE
ncbi:AI-2E family transporter [Olivibacter sitiensis]|uniref:AI-2E family transporter n=1 Tax=Olivibacter sitiensis TaxID=376470 RepID=UPI0004834BB5|nr:AI-2E family transporter [Olivibacter sitiensis]